MEFYRRLPQMKHFTGRPKNTRHQKYLVGCWVVTSVHRVVGYLLCLVFLRRDNFLILDIYYQEIVYTEIRELPAFELLSLMSEIGEYKSLMASV